MPNKITNRDIKEFLSDYTKNSKTEILEEGSDRQELEAIAKARGIKLQGNRDLAGFKTIYAFTNQANKNNAILPEKQLLKALPSMIGKPVDVDHIRNQVIGHYIDYSYRAKDNAVVAYGLFYKSNFGDLWEEAKELFKSGKLATSYEIWCPEDKRNELSDGTYELLDMEIAGGALLFTEEPAFEDAKVLELAKKYKMNKDLVFSSKYKEDELIYCSEEKYECECVSCGHIETSTEHCRDLKCSKCGGEMRRANRPSKDNYNKSSEEGGNNNMKVEEEKKDIEEVTEVKEEEVKEEASEKVEETEKSSEAEEVSKEEISEEAPTSEETDEIAKTEGEDNDEAGEEVVQDAKEDKSEEVVGEDAVAVEDSKVSTTVTETTVEDVKENEDGTIEQSYEVDGETLTIYTTKDGETATEKTTYTRKNVYLASEVEEMIATHDEALSLVPAHAKTLMERRATLDVAHNESLSDEDILNDDKFKMATLEIENASLKAKLETSSVSLEVGSEVVGSKGSENSSELDTAAREVKEKANKYLNE